MTKETLNYRTTEAFGLREPEFDCGRFTMVFSDQPQGFEVETDQSFPRRPDGTPLPLTPNQKIQLKTAMQNQFGFTTADKAKEALKAYRADSNDETRSTYLEANRQYQDRFSIVAGARNFRRERFNKNKLIMDVRPVNFPVFSLFAKPQESRALQDFSGNSSTTLILETSDEYGILQYRDPDKNAGWPGTPAASASGYIDNIPFQKEDKPSNNRRRLQKITTEDIIDNAMRELDEELGIKKVIESGKILIRDENVAIRAMVHEKGSIHDEFLVMAKADATAYEVMEEARKTQKNEKLHEQEFREKYIVFKATPENILKLVAKVKVPLPYSHCAAWIAKGFEKMLERGSLSDALQWRKDAQNGARSNYNEIDRLVRLDLYTNRKKLTTFPDRLLNRVDTRVTQYKIDNPSATSEEIEAERQRQLDLLPKRNPAGYSNMYTPEEQGLKSMLKGLKDEGIIFDESQMN